MDSWNEKSFELISELSMLDTLAKRAELITNYLKATEESNKYIVNDFEEGNWTVDMGDIIRSIEFRVYIYGP